MLKKKKSPTDPDYNCNISNSKDSQEGTDKLADKPKFCVESQRQSQKQKAWAQTESSQNNTGEKGGRGGHFQHEGSNPAARKSTTAQQRQRRSGKVASFAPEMRQRPERRKRYDSRNDASFALCTRRQDCTITSPTDLLPKHLKPRQQWPF